MRAGVRLPLWLAASDRLVPLGADLPVVIPRRYDEGSHVQTAKHEIPRGLGMTGTVMRSLASSG